MTRYSHAHLDAGLLEYTVCNLVGNRRIFPLCHFFLVLFLGERRILLGDGSLGNRKYGKSFSCLRALVDRGNHFLDVVRYFRKQNNIRAPRNASIKRQPADFMPHDLNNKDAVVGRCRRVDTVNAICGDIDGTLKSECDVRPVNIVVDRLRQMDNI